MAVLSSSREPVYYVFCVFSAVVFVAQEPSKELTTAGMWPCLRDMRVACATDHETLTAILQSLLQVLTLCIILLHPLLSPFVSPSAVTLCITLCCHPLHHLLHHSASPPAVTLCITLCCHCSYVSMSAGCAKHEDSVYRLHEELIANSPLAGLYEDECRAHPVQQSAHIAGISLGTS